MNIVSAAPISCSIMRHRLDILLVTATCVALFVHARWFDFTCDDAFIAFRYAANWVQHGQIVYNLGERVEGYTSFASVALLATLHRVGVPLPFAARLLGAVSGVLLLVGAAQYARLLMPARPLGVALLLALVAFNASVAAWTLGGLETPLFAALGVFSIVHWARWLEVASKSAASRDASSAKHALFVACLLATTTLTRPEGALLFVSCAMPVGYAWICTRRVPRGALLLLVVYLSILSSYLLFRRFYYGDWLPNTFYLKTSGSSTELRARGIEYLAFCGEEFAPVFVIAVLVLAFVPRRRDNEGGSVSQSGLPPRRRDWRSNIGDSPGVRFARHAAQLYIAGTLVYVASIGGDFLDLYRFIVPILPLLFGLAIEGGLQLAEAATGALPRASAISSKAQRWLQSASAVALLVWYVPHQVALGARARSLSEPGRRAHGIEPIGWTATYARRWAATGRWIAAHSKPGDWLAVGAAGAMPYYSGLPNIDTFGLCDSYVARQGTIIGSRPGHQRFAPLDYLLRRAPTFLLIGDYATDDPTRFRQDPAWMQRGYVWVEAQILPAIHGAPTAFYHYVLVRKDRAAELVSQPHARVAGH